MTEKATVTARYPARFERAILAKAEAWLAGILAPDGAPDGAAAAADPPPAKDPRLILLCMTPRSGSTALSAALASTGRLGLGGERLNHKNKTLNEIAAETRPRTRRDLLERVIDASRTRNGVAQIKCGLEHVLPFLLDGPCQAILAQAHVVYLTRGDLLGQAISRHRAITAGVYHARGAETPTGAEAPFSLEAIHAQLEYLTQTMAAYEKVFTVLNIRPMRITYEQITAETGHVVCDIARLVDVTIDPAAISGLDAGGHKKVSGSNNDTLRARFLAEAPAQAFAATR